MDNSIYIMLSKQNLLFREMGVRANNLANATTTGYNAEAMVFRPYLMDAGDRNKMAFAENAATFRNVSEGPIKSTGGTLDVAIKGSGYFAVETPLGTRYTRAGNFQIDREGTLISQEGYPVLDASGQTIQFEENDRDIVIGEVGNVSVQGVERGQIGVYEFDNEQQLERAGGTMFRADAGARLREDAQIVQGALEGSNVQPVTELTGVIELQRAVAQTAKFIENMYELQRKASSVLARTT